MLSKWATWASGTSGSTLGPPGPVGEEDRLVNKGTNTNTYPLIFSTDPTGLNMRVVTTPISIVGSVPFAFLTRDDHVITSVSNLDLNTSAVPLNPSIILPVDIVLTRMLISFTIFNPTLPIIIPPGETLILAVYIAVSTSPGDYTVIAGYDPLVLDLTGIIPVGISRYRADVFILSTPIAAGQSIVVCTRMVGDPLIIPVDTFSRTSHHL